MYILKIDIYNELNNFDIQVEVYDPWVNPEEVKNEFGIDVIINKPVDHFAAVILAVAHKEFLDMDIKSFSPNGVIFDVKGILPKEIVNARL